MHSTPTGTGVNGKTLNMNTINSEKKGFIASRLLMSIRIRFVDMETLCIVLNVLRTIQININCVNEKHIFSVVKILPTQLYRERIWNYIAFGLQIILLLTFVKITVTGEVG